MLRFQYKGRGPNFETITQKETCFQCSVCSLLCVVQHMEGYDHRNTFLYDLLQDPRPYANRALWACSGCHKCEEVCPQDIRPAHLIADLQERSFEEGYAPAYVWNLTEMVLLTGMAFPVTAKTLKERKKLGMGPPPSPPVEEIQRIAQRTGLQEKMERLRKRSRVFRSLSESIRRSLDKGAAS
jgi:heterodisulfide reductase subunit C